MKFCAAGFTATHSLIFPYWVIHNQYDKVVEESQRMPSFNIAKNKIKISKILEQENRSCKTLPLFLEEWSKLVPAWSQYVTSFSDILIRAKLSERLCFH